MTISFKNYLDETELLAGYVASSLISQILIEGRKNPDKLASKDFNQGKLFTDPDPEEDVDRFIQGQPAPEEGDKCEVTPLSGYAKHIEAIQAYARSSPENFAQVLMFSPLSANTSFAKHWDNFQVLMMILKHNFPHKVTPEQIKEAVIAFNDKYHNLQFSITGWKFDTIAEIWSNREELFQELNQLAKAGDDVKLMRRLVQLPGVQPVKAGFIAQLLWGKAGCIDTHNIDIYNKVYPDLNINPKQWTKKKGGIEDYMNLLHTLDKRGIGTKELWDVWVQFVERMYIIITQHHQGHYGFQGAALDQENPKLADLKGISIPKQGVGREGEAMVPLLKGKVGMGASATHLPMDPDEALKQFYGMHHKGERGSSAARAVSFLKDRVGNPLDQSLGVKPSSLHYFEPAISPRSLETDPERIRDIIRRRIRDREERKAWLARQQPDLPGLEDDSYA